MSKTDSKKDSSNKGEWWFYHLERDSLENALGPLLEKCLQVNWRVLIVAGEERLRRLDVGLWGWKPESFLPHGRIDNSPERQPILLSTVAEPINGANIAVLLDGHDLGGGPEKAKDYARCMVVFDGDDFDTRNKARSQFKAAKDAGLVVRYFQQNDRGGWDEKS